MIGDIESSFAIVLTREGVMPIHDWKRVRAGSFHHFHQTWVVGLCSALNAGLLLRGYYAIAEQKAIGVEPDVLAMRLNPVRARPGAGGGAALAEAVPATRFVARSATDRDAALYAAKADRIAIRHELGHVVSVVEVVSPGNKASARDFAAFVSKSVDFIAGGVHLLVVNLFPPTSRDPQGIHKAIWDNLQEDLFELPTDQPLVAASYDAGEHPTAYIETLAAGDELPSMPLFLEPGRYVLAPLEATYLQAWASCPEPLRDALDPQSAP